MIDEAKPPITHIWCVDTKATMCQKVKDAGGWPAEACSLVLQHCEQRTCYFSAAYPHDGWNTVVITRDDYYWWAISDSKKAEIEKEITRKLKNKILDALD